jgi:hypothetical protein
MNPLASLSRSELGLQCPLTLDIVRQLPAEWCGLHLAGNLDFFFFLQSLSLFCGWSGPPLSGPARGAGPRRDHHGPSVLRPGAVHPAHQHAGRPPGAPHVPAGAAALSGARPRQVRPLLRGAGPHATGRALSTLRQDPGEKPPKIACQESLPGENSQFRLP